MPVPSKHTINVGITDDHQLFVKSLSLLIGTFASCNVIIEAASGHELEKALHEIDTKGHYNANVSNINYRRLIRRVSEEAVIHISERKKRFLHLACTDKIYRQIPTEINLAERIMDWCGKALFHEFNMQIRVGMSLEVIRRNYVSL